MSKFKYTNIAGEKCLCSCTQYEECNTGCSLYRRITGKQTNADRIRGMTDEELAHLLHDHSCSLCPLNYKCDGRVEVGRKKCKEYWLRWLQGPVNLEAGK